MGFMYGGVEVSPEWAQMWRDCAKIRYLVEEHMNNGIDGVDKLKEMFRKLKLILIIEKGEIFDFGGQSPDEHVVLDDNLEVKSSELHDLIMESTPCRASEEISIVDSIYHYLDTGFTVDMMLVVLNQKQGFFEEVNSRVEIFDKMMMNVNGSVLASSIYQSFEKMMRDSSEKVTRLTESYSGLTSMFLSFQYASLKDIFRRLVLHIKDQGNYSREIINGLKWKFNQNELEMSKVFNMEKMLKSALSQNLNSNLLESMFETLQHIQTFYLRLVYPLPGCKNKKLSGS